MFLPTSGARIRAYPCASKALLVMDIQESSTRGGTVSGPPSTSTPFGRMIHNTNRLIDQFSLVGFEVAYVRQVFTSNLITRLHGGRILAGRMEPRISRWIRVINNNDFAKNRTDAFSSRRMEQFLVDHQVNEIYLVGLDAAFCVYYTALGALQRGYRVTVVTDAVMTGRAWDKVLEKYRRKGIAVTCTEDILRQMSGTPVR